MGHVTMENRNDRAIDATLTHASGTAEREAALDMVGGMMVVIATRIASAGCSR